MVSNGDAAVFGHYLDSPFPTMDTPLRHQGCSGRSPPPNRPLPAHPSVSHTAGDDEGPSKKPPPPEGTNGHPLDVVGQSPYFKVRSNVGANLEQLFIPNHRCGQDGSGRIGWSGFRSQSTHPPQSNWGVQISIHNPDDESRHTFPLRGVGLREEHHRLPPDALLRTGRSQGSVGRSLWNIENTQPIVSESNSTFCHQNTPTAIRGLFPSQRRFLMRIGPACALRLRVGAAWAK